MSRKIRPASAGLKGLHPKPPKVIFPMPIATSAPMMIIQMGRLLGRLNPSNIPVSTALPSVMVIRSRFNMNLAMAHSKKTHDATEVSITMAAPKPKNQRLAAKAGSRAIHTPYILRCTLSPPCTWGESEMIGFM